MKADTPRYRVSTIRGHIADINDLNVILSVLSLDYELFYFMTVNKGLREDLLNHHNIIIKYQCYMLVSSWEIWGIGSLGIRIA